MMVLSGKMSDFGIPMLELDPLVKNFGPRGGKYYRRVPTGNPKRPWRYYYTREEYERDHGDQAHHDGREVSEARQRQRSGEIVLTRKQLMQKLRKGHYSIISAGRNPSHPEEGKLPEDHPKFAARHEELRRELQKAGLKYTEVEGSYGGKEKSFIVYHYDRPKSDRKAHESAFMVHHDSPNDSGFAFVRKLGKKFNQESVIHSRGGKHEMWYTVGPHAGMHHKGEGFRVLHARAKDFYTQVPTKKKPTKFALNFDFDAYHDAESAMHKSQRFIVPGDRLFKAWQPWHRYISKKPDGHGSVHDKKLKKAYAGHKYISKKRGPDGKWVYTYQRPDGGQYGSPHAPTTWQMRTSDEGRKVSRKRERHKRMSESTQKSMAQHAPEESIMEEIMESTPELREQIKMLIEQQDPFAKGLYAFEAGYNRKLESIPDAYLAAYLDAFIEQAYESEKGERCHDDGVLVGPSQPGANGGPVGDEADWWAQWVMNCLVTYIGKNANLKRACAKVNCNKEYIASRLRSMGLVKPMITGSESMGDFSEGYHYSEAQSAALKSLSRDQIVSEDELLKSLARNQRILNSGELVPLDYDDSSNPIAALRDMHRARFELMEAVYDLDLGYGRRNDGR